MGRDRRVAASFGRAVQNPLRRKGLYTLRTEPGGVAVAGVEVRLADPMAPLPDLPDACVTRDDLLRKYLALEAMRASPAGPGARALRALVREFPGALRELDALTPAEIASRVAALTPCRALDEAPPWAARIAGYHGLMRVTLAVKRLIAGRPLAEVDCARLGRCARGLDGGPLGEDFVRAVASPPRGRLNLVVFRYLGARFGESSEDLWQSLFPTPRDDRFVPRAGR